LKERDFENVLWENQTLYTKLENLENVFIGAPIARPSNLKSHMFDSKSQLTQDY